MSFILDALKKSESDRQRQSGPALFEVKVAPPKSGFPVWAIAIVALLVINMAIVGWMLVRRLTNADSTTAANAATSSVAAAQAPVPQAPAANPTQTASMAVPTSVPAPAAMAGPGSAAAVQAPPALQAPAPIPATTPAATPPATSAQAESQFRGRDMNEPTLAGNAGASGGSSLAPASESSSNPDDYAPATEPGASLFKGHVKRGTENGLPLYQDAAVAPGATLPQLRLDLHVYAAKPQDRFALINMHKMHEGDSLPDGVRVETITPDGVVLSRNGAKFLLPRE